MREIFSAIARGAEAIPGRRSFRVSAAWRPGSAKRSWPTESRGSCSAPAAGMILTVGDCEAVLVRAQVPRPRYSFCDNPAVSIRVDRSPRGDAIEIQRKVEEVARRDEGGLPEAPGSTSSRGAGRIHLAASRHPARQPGLAWALGLARALSVPFLNSPHRLLGSPPAFRWTMTAALALMYAAGITLNMNLRSSRSSINTLGIVANDAIVVGGEHADLPVREPAGTKTKTAAERAAGGCSCGLPRRRSPNGHRVLSPRAIGGRRRPQSTDISVHRDRRADRLAGGCFPHPAEPTWPMRSPTPPGA